VLFFGGGGGCIWPTYMLQETTTADSTLYLGYELYDQGISLRVQAWVTIVSFLVITYPFSHWEWGRGTRKGYQVQN